MDFFANCGSLKAGNDGIEKIDTKVGATGDEQRGYCKFSSTYLSKDSEGNLVETVRAASCSDGYTGPLQPIVYKKK
ncbi:MAG: hypothetical protein EOP04_20230 [Proteobacteria bacterium]|nr:MAG: hypothetical protein EOP04_20230 [Pseudomonadota bacterium]